MKLESVIAQSKVTLVYLWASNAPNRNEYERDLRILYKKYHDKGLNIVAVSADRYLEEWLETIKTEQYPWVNTIDRGGKITEDVYYEFGGH